MAGSKDAPAPERTNVMDSLALCSVEKFGEMLLSNVSEACMNCSVGVDSLLDKNPNFRCGTSSGVGSSSVPVNSRNLGPATTAATTTLTASIQSSMHDKAFPPLKNVVSEREVFSGGGGASESLAVFFDDGAPLSMAKFHAHRGDDDIRFGRWLSLPRSQLERSRSVIVEGRPHGGIGRRAVRRQQSQSLIGDVPPFLLSMPTLERRASFRTPVRLPAAGMSVTEVSVVQRMLHLGEVRGGVKEGRSYVIETVLKLLDVPYSNRFRVVIRHTMSTESAASGLRQQQQQGGGISGSDRDLCGGNLACANSLACANPLRDAGESLCSFPDNFCAHGTTIGQVGKRSQLGGSENVDCHDSSKAAVVRVEFEIQFNKGCQFEDRIRKMLTKKMTKLLKSWCGWAQEGWTEIKAPSAEVATKDADKDDDKEVAGSATRQKKWQSLSKREDEGDNDAMLLWSMTDLEDDVDDEELRYGCFQPMEWRNRSLTPSIDEDDFFQDSGTRQGHGVELCLCDDESNSHELDMFESSQVSDCGLEVVYVTDESSDEETENPVVRPSAPTAHRASNGGLRFPLKARSRSDGFRKRGNMFRQQQKKMKVLEEHDVGDF